MTVTFPSAEDYLVAVQQPQAFELPNLRSATFSMHPQWHIPMATSGSAAVVFRAAVGGSDSALRFFTHDSAEQARYAAVGRHVADRGLTGEVARATWRSDAIRIRGVTWPVVEMEWVEGRTLDAYVADLVEQGDTASLGLLAQEWRRLIGRLQTAEFAHGDLQHGNVLVDTRGHLRLVDLDGSWIPELAGLGEPGESGHPNYQRRDRVWGPWMDTFPGLVVYTALLGLAALPPTVDPHWIDDKIVFSERDLVSSVHTPAWTLLDGLPDPRVRHALQLLRTCCASDWRATCSLEELLENEPGTPAPRGGPPTAGIPGAKGPRAAGTPWWIMTAPGAVDPQPLRLPPPDIRRPDPEPARPAPPLSTPDDGWVEKLQAAPSSTPTNAAAGLTALLVLLCALGTAAVVFLVLFAIAAPVEAAIIASFVSGVIVACGVLTVRKS